MPQVRTNQLAETEAPAPIGHNKPPTPLDLLKSDLAEVYGAQIAEAGPIATRANDAPEVIASDADLAVWAKIGVDAATLFKTLDTARLNEKRPVVAAVDEFFQAATARLDRISSGATKRATDWNKKKIAIARAAQAVEDERLRKEAEAQRETARIAAEFEDVDQAVEAAGQAAAIETQIAAAPQPSAADLTRTRTDDGILSTTRTDWLFAIEDYSKVDLNAISQFIDPAAIDKAVRRIVKIRKGETKIAGVRVFTDETAQFRR
jgi:hypothetical protein